MAKDDVIFSLRLSAELKRALDALAAADDRSLNNYIQRVLQAHVSAQPKKVPK